MSRFQDETLERHALNLQCLFRTDARALLGARDRQMALCRFPLFQGLTPECGSG